MIYEVMEAKEGIALSSGVTVKAEEAPDGFRMEPRNENSTPSPNPNPDLNQNNNHDPNPDSNSNTNPSPNPNPGQLGAPQVGASPVSAGCTDTGGKKKRGRPRKYAPDGTLATALSPMPISSSIPLTGDYSAWKRGRGRPLESVKKQHNCEYESTGDKIAYFVGTNFMPHVITVNAGEDVTMKVMSFSQQGARAICILSANGTISNVTLRQPTSSGGTLTYEGRFEILSLSGSFMPSENGGTKGRSGGMSVSLAGSDGRVVGGGLAGMLVAAGPVQVVVGSFLLGHQQESKHKKQRIELAPAVIPATIPATINVVSSEEMKGSYGVVRPVVIPSPFHGDNPASLNPMQA
ncbi:AT-HOOK MOTIF NUCLEAR-LOCALIZED PROTEIN 9 [Salix viminalis]|uniref:AT-hook motif nuclear-localized protein n=1 Tax=Salix viminalis TaxID=40686 RepID=A0A9Q0SC28_SALVM|nr:AT-HOOK MOTIF NUCLEAR-LOCALIZED PROTEIN 9 [Salix viminalis]